MQHSTPAVIVVGIDGSDESLRAFAWALAETAGRGGRVLAVHAVDAPSVPLQADGTEAPMPSYSVVELEAAATVYLDGLVAQGRRAGVDVEALVVREARPANALTRLSADADLLVVGSHGLGGMAGLVVGSVSRQCLRRAACPVVVLPPMTGADKR